jgi:hypothetical protein
MDVDGLLADERARWEALRAAFDDVPEQRFEEPGLTPEGWSPKDLLFHMVGWMNECSAVLERERAGTPPPEGGVDTDTRNSNFFRASQAMSAEDVRAAVDPARERMIANFMTFDEVTPRAWEWFEESGPIHYAEHEKDLRAWIERVGP